MKAKWIGYPLSRPPAHSTVAFRAMTALWGSAEAQTLRNGFSLGNSNEREGIDSILSYDLVERPQSWDFLEEGLLIPEWLQATQPVDRVVKFTNTSKQDWSVENFKITDSAWV